MKKSSTKDTQLITIIAIITCSIFFITLVSAEIRLRDFNVKLNLTEGKNYINFSSSIYANELIAQNPSIQVISYTQEDTNETIGFVNIFGGIGKNFILIPGRTYEIISSQNNTLQQR